MLRYTILAGDETGGCEKMENENQYEIKKLAGYKNAQNKTFEIQNGMIILTDKKYPNQPNLFFMSNGIRYDIMVHSYNGELELVVFMPDNGKLTLRGVGIGKTIIKPIDKNYPNQHEIEMVSDESETGENSPDSDIKDCVSENHEIESICRERGEF